jgi:hypothetical protein
LSEVNHNKFKITPPPKLKQFDYTEKFGPENGFREGTELNPAPMAFFLNAGGLGDYLNYSAAILWVAKNCPWIHGTVYVSSFLREFLASLFASYKNWKVEAGEKVTMQQDICFAGPELKVNDGIILNHQLLNATGAHLFDLGFAYYANMNPPPIDATLPYVNYPEKKVHFELRPLKGKYIVFTPGAITPSRYLTGKHLNPLIKYVKEKGYLPVFLGKNEVTKDLNPVFPDDVLYSEGLDLRNKTTIPEAAAILQYSKCAIGIDNGLLWLGSLTDTNVIFGYSLAGPKNRKPKRSKICAGKTIDVALTKEELICNHCQDQWKLLIGHTFHKCLYDDNKCIELLFANDAKKFKDALEKIGV